MIVWRASVGDAGDCEGGRHGTAVEQPSGTAVHSGP